MTTDILLYLLKASIVLTLLYSFFSLLMRREASHHLNRVLLVGTLVLTWGLPLTHPLPLPVREGSSYLSINDEEVPEKADAPQDNEQVATKQSLHNTISPSEDATKQEPEAQQMVWEKVMHNLQNILLPSLTGRGWGVGLWLLGFAFFLLRFLRDLVAIFLLIRRGRRMQVGGVPADITVVATPEIDAAVNWMRFVLINPDETAEGQRMMLRHEVAHVRMGHSWDMLLAELSVCLLWFHPFAWALRRDLRDVHEFEADEATIASGFDLDGYQRLLARKASSRTRRLAIVNAIQNSDIHRRFEMMYCRTTRRRAWSRAAVLLPFVGTSLVACSWLTPREFPLQGWWHFDWIQTTGTEMRHVIPFEQVHVFSRDAMFDIHWSQRSDRALTFGFSTWKLQWDGQTYRSRDGHDSIACVNGLGQVTAFTLPDRNSHIMQWERQPDQLVLVAGPSITEHWTRCEPDRELQRWLTSALEANEIWYAQEEQGDRSHILFTRKGQLFTLWVLGQLPTSDNLHFGGTGACGQLDDTGRVNLGGQDLLVRRTRDNPSQLTLHFTANSETFTMERLDELPKAVRRMLETLN